MNPCPNCGANPRPTDKFCNTCGTPIVASPAPPAAQFSASAGWGTPPPAPRCQMGHEVPPGQNYCPQGHPIALEQVQFAPSGQPQQPPYTPAAHGSGAKYAQAGSSGASQAAAAYGPAPQNAYPPPYPPQPPAYPPPQQGYAPPAPPPAPPPAGYAAPPPTGYAVPAGAVAPVDAKAATASAAIVPSALTGFLVSFDANPSGDFWPLNGGRHSLGRANSGESVDIPLADATISSRHAVLEVDAVAGRLVVEDTGSTNGTFVNDEHVGFSGRRDLRDGDRLRLGGFTTIVKVIARG